MALATITQLRSFLGHEVVTRDDALLSSILDAASAFFEKECGRTITATEYTIAVDGNGMSSMTLPAAPVVSVESLTINGEDIPERATWDGSGYVLDGDRIRLVGYCFTQGVANVTITYTAGYDPVPNDVVMAVCELAAMKYRQRDSIGVFSRAIVGQEQTMYQTVTLPIQIKAVIDSYRLVPVA